MYVTCLYKELIYLKVEPPHTICFLTHKVFISLSKADDIQYILCSGTVMPLVPCWLFSHHMVSFCHALVRYKMEDCSALVSPIVEATNGMCVSVNKPWGFK